MNLCILAYITIATTLPQKTLLIQASTSLRGRFFNAFDHRLPGTSVRNVVKRLQFNQPTFISQPRTCERWLRQRRLLGYLVAIHRQGKSHKKASKILDSHLDTLL
jgi:hypothetical protein